MVTYPADIKDVCEKIIRDFNDLPEVPRVTVLKGHAFNYLSEIESEVVRVEDALLYAGVDLAYSRAIQGRLGDVEKISGGIYVKNSYGWDVKDFANVALKAYTRGFSQAKRHIPDEAQEIVRKYHPAWFKKIFGLEFREDLINVLLEPVPALLPFDHYTSDRNFIGKVAHYPKEFERRVFSYMKAWYLPPIMWYSDRIENDAPTYKKESALKVGITLEQSVEQTGIHEASHVLVADPIVEIILLSSKHCWLTEGIAQYYGDIYTINNYLRSIREVKTPIDIADDLGKPVDYISALLLVTALGAKFSGSVKETGKGVVKILEKLASHADLMLDGKAEQLPSPLELLYVIDPSLKRDNEQQLLVSIMEDVISNL